MDNLNVIDILKLGLPGLVFLLSVLSFNLLTKEQSKSPPSDNMMKSIKQFMFINIFLAILTVVAPLSDKYIGGSTGYSVFSASANAHGDNLGKGNAAVCTSVPYANRHLLIKDVKYGKAIQVYAQSVIPCGDNIQISLTPEDASNLGWENGESSSAVEVVSA